MDKTDSGLKRAIGSMVERLQGVNVRETLFSRNQAVEFQGRVALITGGSRGLGYLLAREFGREGCRVAICARDDAELREAALQLEQAGIEVFAITCDIADQSAVQRMIDAVTDYYGRIEILVNNAGIIEVGPLETMTAADFETAMGIMFWGVLYPTLAVIPQMKRRGAGWIVNITSIGGKISAPHLLPYNSAKFAAVGLSEGLHAELAKDGISVTTIAPGLMRTGSYLNAFFKGLREREYAWFSLAANLPFISMDAERAAAQIVRATRYGEAERILSFPAAAAVRFHGLFPGVTADILGLVNRLLPESSSRSIAPGRDVDQRIGSGLMQTLTAFGRSAARRFNE